MSDTNPPAAAPGEQEGTQNIGSKRPRPDAAEEGAILATEANGYNDAHQAEAPGDRSASPSLPSDESQPKASLSLGDSVPPQKLARVESSASGPTNAEAPDKQAASNDSVESQQAK